MFSKWFIIFENIHSFTDLLIPWRLIKWLRVRITRIIKTGYLSPWQYMGGGGDGKADTKWENYNHVWCTVIYVKLEQERKGRKVFWDEGRLDKGANVWAEILSRSVLKEKEEMGISKRWNSLEQFVNSYTGICLNSQRSKRHCWLVVVKKWFASCKYQ